MTTATAIHEAGGPGQALPAHEELPAVRDELQALWAMTAAERVAEMWHGGLTLRQLSKWSSRAPHEVPLLGGEFAWIAMRMPEWAEASQSARVSCTVPRDQEVDQ